jgi:hypothetical protein
MLAGTLLAVLMLTPGCDDDRKNLRSGRDHYSPYRYERYDGPRDHYVVYPTRYETRYETYYVPRYESHYAPKPVAPKRDRDWDRGDKNKGKNPNYRDPRGNWSDNADYREGWRIRTGTNDDSRRRPNTPPLQADDHTPRRDRDDGDRKPPDRNREGGGRGGRR